MPLILSVIFAFMAACPAAMANFESLPWAPLTAQHEALVSRIVAAINEPLAALQDGRNTHEPIADRLGLGALEGVLYSSSRTGRFSDEPWCTGDLLLVLPMSVDPGRIFNLCLDTVNGGRSVNLFAIALDGRIATAAPVGKKLVLHNKRGKQIYVAGAWMADIERLAQDLEARLVPAALRHIQGIVAEHELAIRNTRECAEALWAGGVDDENQDEDRDADNK